MSRALGQAAPNVGVWEQSAHFPTTETSIVAHGEERTPISQLPELGSNRDSLVNFRSPEYELKRWKKVQKKAETVIRQK